MTARDTIPFRAMLAIAARSDEVNESKVRLVLDLLGTATTVRSYLRHELSDLGLNELDVSILVMLLAISPDPSTPGTLAEQTGVTRAALTDAIDRLEHRGLVRRERHLEDRRKMHVHITTAGVRMADTGMSRLLQRVHHLAREVDPQEGASTLAVCKRLCDEVLHPALHAGAKAQAVT